MVEANCSLLMTLVQDKDIIVQICTISFEKSKNSVKIVENFVNVQSKSHLGIEQDPPDL